jgi:cell wall-associated NlpC family hydrolase
MSLQGIKYKYGGSSPETGFDCSGLVNYVFRESANVNLPRTSRAISKVGKNISRDALAPGDLVFFNTLRSPFSHVGIYVGDNNFIHAPRSGKTVRIENMDLRYWKTRFNGAKRLNQEVISAK